MTRYLYLVLSQIELLSFRLSGGILLKHLHCWISNDMTKSSVYGSVQYINPQTDHNLIGFTPSLRLNLTE